MNPLTPKDRARRLVRGLRRLYPDARCSLDHDGPLQLLVATILSAQCTDARVNQVTPALFARYPDVAAFASADLGELESLIQSTGFFRNKARNILLCCTQIVERHGGHVPDSMAELVALAGVGRKTANVVLGNAFGIPGIPVDTHVGRLSRRMGLTENADPVAVERDLMAVIPSREWSVFGLRMIYHGRAVCQARKPMCESCELIDSCAQVGVGEDAPDETETPAVLSQPDARARDASDPSLERRVVTADQTELHAQRTLPLRKSS